MEKRHFTVRSQLYEPEECLRMGGKIQINANGC